jgi:hypothetical protein
MVRILELLVAFTVAGLFRRRQPSNLECLAVSVVVNALHAASGANSFCSSLSDLSPTRITYMTTSTSTSTSVYDTATSTVAVTNATIGTSVGFFQLDMLFGSQNHYFRLLSVQAAQEQRRGH